MFLYPSLKSLPGSSPYTANPTPKSGKVWFFRIFGRFFRLPKRMSKLTSKKRRKKCENRGFRLPKSLPKPSRNAFKIDVPKNMRFFIVFCLMFLVFSIFDFLKISVSPRREPIFKVFAKIVFSLFACIFGPKNLPKTLPKRCPNPSKVDAKNGLFFNFDFFGFWPRFGNLLGLQDGAKLAQNALPRFWRSSSGGFQKPS